MRSKSIITLALSASLFAVAPVGVGTAHAGPAGTNCIADEAEMNTPLDPTKRVYARGKVKGNGDVKFRADGRRWAGAKHKAAKTDGAWRYNQAVNATPLAYYEASDDLDASTAEQKRTVAEAEALPAQTRLWAVYSSCSDDAEARVFVQFKKVNTFEKHKANHKKDQPSVIFQKGTYYRITDARVVGKSGQTGERALLCDEGLNGDNWQDYLKHCS